MTIATVLGQISTAEFLREYWQKKPLLIRQALPDFISPLSPEELAGLACEEDVPARLILESGGDHPWQLKQGPFTEADFTKLPEDGYSLLVTDCDKLIPDLMSIVERFRFVPDWRIDDLMISYAPPGGSVGAHIDEYDVFLLQGMGRRRWMIEYPVIHREFVPGLDIRLLAEFTPTDEWVLEPGDMLYLPPGVPHHGVAIDPCMTFSIGFRAPLWHELTAGVADRLQLCADQSARYTDPALSLQENPGELTAAMRQQLRAGVRALLNADDALLDRLIAETLSERPLDHAAFYPQQEPLSREELIAELQAGEERLMRTPAARLILVESESTYLAHDGATLALTPAMLPLARLLTRAVFFDSAAVLAAIAAPEAADWLVQLYADGVVQWQPRLLP
ncbi:cupin domain-containing protein [Halothiobacillus sp. DCM-1]|uniref:cupin domain-containing protein n=1 Tax=Halothiobacillus sp. DCM-1 TaxID=3112558 RepID=UPI00324A79FE